MSNDPTFWTLIVNAAVVGVAWVSGEAGRIAVAGGAGGIARWLNTERKRVRDGVIAVIGGSLAATYLWPLVLAIIGFPLGGLDQNVNNVAMAAFVAGALGMSGVKIAVAMVEARDSKKGGEDA